MNGDIGVNSTNGLGSEFWFTALFSKQSKQEPEPKLPPDIGDVKILIVDDNATNREIIMTLLKKWGAHPHETHDGPSALQQLIEAHISGKPYHLAILDMQMPDMDGEELGKKIKSSSMIADVPMIMLTSIARKEDSTRFGKLGFSAVLSKPVRQKDLFNTILSILTDRPLTMNQSMLTQKVSQHIQQFNARVLLVEDNDVNQEVAQVFIQRLGILSDIAKNGKEAIQQLEKKHYDLVLMDCQMPEMDGFEATKEIRNQSSKVLDHDIIIIAMTANAMKGDRQKCLDVGMNDYLSKPLKIKTLSDMLMKWIGDSVIDESYENNEKIENKTIQPISDDLSLFNPTELNQILEDLELTKYVVSTALVDIPKQMEKLKKGLSENNISTLTHITHTIKGIASSLCSEMLREMAFEMEQLAGTEQIDVFRDRLPALERLVEKFLQTLQKFVE